MVNQQRDRVYGWGCGNDYHRGCGFWIPLYAGCDKKEYCIKCGNDVPHHFWIYDEEVDNLGASGGTRRWGEWFCITCFGALPEGRDKATKETTILSKPVPLSPEERQARIDKAVKEKYKDALHLWFVKGRNPKHGHEQWEAYFEERLHILREEDEYHSGDGLVPVEIFREFPGSIVLVRRI